MSDTSIVKGSLVTVAGNIDLALRVSSVALMRAAHNLHSGALVCVFVLLAAEPQGDVWPSFVLLKPCVREEHLEL